MQNIHGTAMLANLRISQWTARKIDKRVAGEVAKTHNVQASVGAYYKSVLPTTDANGERKLFRTEAWMGGSPVLFVSKAPVEALQAAEVEKTLDENAAVTQTVDASAKTSALDETAAREAATATMLPSQEFDPAGFELRVN